MKKYSSAEIGTGESKASPVPPNLNPEIIPFFGIPAIYVMHRRVDVQNPADEENGKTPFIIAGMPMYNEEETIGTVVTMVSRYVDQVICVDDGSSDASARIAEANGATVLRHRVNRGYGGALKTLFHKS